MGRKIDFNVGSQYIIKSPYGEKLFGVCVWVSNDNEFSYITVIQSNGDFLPEVTTMLFDHNGTHHYRIIDKNLSKNPKYIPRDAIMSKLDGYIHTIPSRYVIEF